MPRETLRAPLTLPLAATSCGSRTSTTRASPFSTMALAWSGSIFGTASFAAASIVFTVVAIAGASSSLLGLRWCVPARGSARDRDREAAAAGRGGAAAAAGRRFDARAACGLQLAAQPGAVEPAGERHRLVEVERALAGGGRERAAAAQAHAGVAGGGERHERQDGGGGRAAGQRRLRHVEGGRLPSRPAARRTRRPRACSSRTLRPSASRAAGSRSPSPSTRGRRTVRLVSAKLTRPAARTSLSASTEA